MAATRDLGLTLLEGIKDRQGRSVVRRNSKYAVRLLERAAASGESMAAASLGYAYGVGQGVRRDSTVAIKWDRRAIGLGETIAMGNLAAEYRRLGNLRLAHQWFLRAAKMGDGDAAVDAGYGYLYGIGVRRNLQSARIMLRLAARTTYVTSYAREEALYNLAIAEVESGSLGRAIPLLQRANRDKDYPEAALLLAQIRGKGEINPCRCRRHLDKHLPGHAKCAQHPANDGQTGRKIAQ